MLTDTKVLLLNHVEGFQLFPHVSRNLYYTGTSTNAIGQKGYLLKGVGGSFSFWPTNRPFPNTAIIMKSEEKERQWYLYLISKGYKRIIQVKQGVTIYDGPIENKL